MYIIDYIMCSITCPSYRCYLLIILAWSLLFIYIKNLYTVIFATIVIRIYMLIKDFELSVIQVESDV